MAAASPNRSRVESLIYKRMEAGLGPATSLEIATELDLPHRTVWEIIHSISRTKNKLVRHKDPAQPKVVRYSLNYQSNFPAIGPLTPKPSHKVAQEKVAQAAAVIIYPEGYKHTVALTNYQQLQSDPALAPSARPSGDDHRAHGSKRGDQIVKFSGRPVAMTGRLADRTRHTKPGE